MTTAMLCLVVSVSAGDAVILSCGDPKQGTNQNLHTLNLRAIAAPEYDQPLAVQSRMHLESMCAGSPVAVTLKGRGRDGAPVADAQCRHLDAATEQVRNGLAWHDEKHGADLLHLRIAQSEAIVAGREIWASPRPTPPWKWKKPRGSTSKR